MKTLSIAKQAAVDTQLSDSRRKRVLKHDVSVDGEFYFSVKVSGVYCRPSCNSRPANPENVTFHSNGVARLFPCKRCKLDLFEQHRGEQTMQSREKITYITLPCIFGHVLVAQSKAGICAILMNSKPAALFADLQDCFPEAIIGEANATLEKLAKKIVAYIEHPTDSLDVKLDIRGTDFQKKVWTELQKIPVGKTASYTDIARKLNHPGAFRAVANACAANVLAVVIPCHRVVKSDGSLSGYRWGVERKLKLLNLEAA